MSDHERLIQNDDGMTFEGTFTPLFAWLSLLGLYQVLAALAAV